MIDQKQSNSISKVIGVVFILFGFCMLCIGIPLLMAPNKGEFENTLTVLSLLSGLLMLLGGYQNIKKGKEKDKAVNDYENQIREQVNAIKNKVQQSNSPYEAKDTDVYTPDIIATWNYTKDEWKLMIKKETTRRLKEGIWVTLLIGLLGGWILRRSEGITFLTGFIISLAVGIIVSLLKVLLSNNLFNLRKRNSIIITTNALIINGKFKTVSDMDIHLEYVKPVKINEDNFIEFSLQWMTRRGVTNDQMRIYVPRIYEKDIQKILDYYTAKGVRTW
ncbi:MAG: hypothetical protein ACKVQB_07135 [Bacteroidia bacterium]